MGGKPFLGPFIRLALEPLAARLSRGGGRLQSPRDFLKYGYRIGSNAMRGAVFQLPGAIARIEIGFDVELLDDQTEALKNAVLEKSSWLIHTKVRRVATDPF